MVSRGDHRAGVRTKAQSHAPGVPGLRLMGRTGRSGGVAEGGALLRRYGGELLHPGFESLLLRQRVASNSSPQFAWERKPSLDHERCPSAGAGSIGPGKPRCLAAGVAIITRSASMSPRSTRGISVSASQRSHAGIAPVQRVEDSGGDPPGGQFAAGAWFRSTSPRPETPPASRAPHSADREPPGSVEQDAGFGVWCCHVRLRFADEGGQAARADARPAESGAGEARGKQKATSLGVAGGLAIAAAVLVVYGIGFAFATAAAGLSEVFSLWLSLLIVTLIILLVAAMAGFLAMRFAKKATPPKPALAIEEAERTVGTLQSHV